MVHPYPGARRLVPRKGFARVGLIRSAAMGSQHACSQQRRRRGWHGKRGRRCLAAKGTPALAALLLRLLLAGGAAPPPTNKGARGGGTPPPPTSGETTKKGLCRAPPHYFFALLWLVASVLSLRALSLMKPAGGRFATREPLKSSQPTPPPGRAPREGGEAPRGWRRARPRRPSGCRRRRRPRTRRGSAQRRAGGRARERVSEREERYGSAGAAAAPLAAPRGAAQREKSNMNGKEMTLSAHLVVKAEVALAPVHRRRALVELHPHGAVHVRLRGRAGGVWRARGLAQQRAPRARWL